MKTRSLRQTVSEAGRPGCPVPVASQLRRLRAIRNARPDTAGQPVKLIFIHHSTGENWLADGQRRAGAGPADNNYFVSDTNYGWGPPTGPGSARSATTRTSATGTAGSPARPRHLPWPRSTPRAASTACYSPPGDRPRRREPDRACSSRASPTRTSAGQSATDRHRRQSAARPDACSEPDRRQRQGHLHRPPAVLRRAPGQALRRHRRAAAASADTTPPRAPTPAPSTTGWSTTGLPATRTNNVAVFDFYNVLTSQRRRRQHERPGRGRAATTTAIGTARSSTSPTRRRTTWRTPTAETHPSAAGDQKATGEFVPLLNIFYHRWQDGEGASIPTVTSVTPDQSSPFTITTVTPVRWTASISGGGAQVEYQFYRQKGCGLGRPRAGLECERELRVDAGAF